MKVSEPKIYCSGTSTPVERLKPHPRNPNTHPQLQIELLAKVIQENGFRAPIVVSLRSGFITKGHGRLAAALAIGCSHVPVDFQDYVSEEMELADMLADNKIAELAEMDTAILAGIVNDLEGKGFDLDLTGLTNNDLSQLFNETKVGETDPDTLPEPTGETGSEHGDVWILGDHRIICGSAEDPEDVGEVLEKETPSLMVTDPPYGVNYDPNWRKELNGYQHTDRVAVKNDDRADWTKAWKLFTGDVVYVWHAGIYTHVVAHSLEAAGFKMRAQIIWNKQNFTFGRGDYHWKHEPCWYGVRTGKNGRYAGDRKQCTVWDIDKEIFDQNHGTQKPVEAMRRPIVNNSKFGDIVYEPFSGSGTTIIACEMTKRKCRALEINPICVDMAVRRWQKFTKKKAITSNGKLIE